MGIKWPRREPVSGAELITLSTEIPLILRFHLNEQQKVKAVRVSGTDSTVKGGLAAVQIGTACWWRVVSGTDSTVKSGLGECRLVQRDGGG